MKSLQKLITFSLFLSTTAMAASLKGTADALGREAIQLGIALGVLGLAIAGTYLALGKQEGGQKVTQAVLGILIVLMAKTVVTTLTSVTGGV